MPELHKNDAEPIIITKGHTLLEKLFCADASQQKTQLASLDYAITMHSHCLKITQKVAFWHFSPIFVPTKMTCLETLLAADCTRSSLRSQA